MSNFCVFAIPARSKIVIFIEIQRVRYFCLALVIFPNFLTNRKFKCILSNANHKAVNRRLRFTHEILHHQTNFHAFQMGKLLKFRFGDQLILSKFGSVKYLLNFFLFSRGIANFFLSSNFERR